MTTLANDLPVEDVVCGENGISESPAIYVSHSTISVRLAKRLTKDFQPHAGLVSAPVLGRPVATATAKPLIVVTGDGEICEATSSSMCQGLRQICQAPDR
jgi:3-hydroxyisobutyrate dehydrogenase-like beta-hydroxyacid dehydrogenase